MYFIVNLLLFITQLVPDAPQKTVWPEKIQVVLDNTKPLAYSRGNRMQLYLWPAMDAGKLSREKAEELVSELDRRGIGLVCSWSMEDTSKVFSECLPVAKEQKKLGQRVNINATNLLESFYTEDDRTAHLGDDRKPSLVGHI